MEIIAIAGAHVFEIAQPFDFFGVQIGFAVNDADVDFEPVFVFQQFANPVIEFQIGADDDEAIPRALDDFFKVVINSTSIENLFTICPWVRKARNRALCGLANPRWAAAVRPVCDLHLAAHPHFRSRSALSPFMARS